MLATLTRLVSYSRSLMQSCILSASDYRQLALFRGGLLKAMEPLSDDVDLDSKNAELRLYMPEVLGSKRPAQPCAMQGTECNDHSDRSDFRLDL